MSSVIRDVVVRVAIEQAKAELQAPDVAPVVAAQERVRVGYENLTISVEDLSSQSVAAFQQQARAAEVLQTELADTAFQAAEGFARAGEGAFTAARGFAFLAASGEESEREMLELIVTAQGAFDVFRGGKDFILGSVEAYRALTPVVAASTVAKTAEAGANTAVATTGAAATTSMVAMQAAFPPLLVVAGLTAAAFGAIAYAMRQLEAEREAVQSVTNAINEQNQALQTRNALTNARITRDATVRSGEADVLQTRLKYADSLEAKLKLLQDEQEKLNRIATPDFGNPTLDTDGLRRVEAMRQSADRIDAANKRQSERLGFLGEWQAGAAGRREDAASRELAIAEQYHNQLKESVDLRADELDVINRKRQMADDEVAIFDSLISKQDQLLERKLKELEASKELIAQERARSQTFQQTVGSLSGQDFQRFQLISQRAQRVGIEGLGREEAGFLRSNFGQFSEFGNQLDARAGNIGRDRNAFGLAGRFGVDFTGDRSRVAEAERSHAQAIREAGREFGNGRIETVEQLKSWAEQVRQATAAQQVEAKNLSGELANYFGVQNRAFAELVKAYSDQAEEIRQIRDSADAGGQL